MVRSSTPQPWEQTISEEPSPLNKSYSEPLPNRRRRSAEQLPIRRSVEEAKSKAEKSFYWERPQPSKECPAVHTRTSSGSMAPSTSSPSFGADVMQVRSMGTAKTMTSTRSATTKSTSLSESEMRAQQAPAQKKRRGWCSGCRCPKVSFGGPIGLRDDDSDSDLSQSEDEGDIIPAGRKVAMIQRKLTKEEIDTCRNRALEKLGVPEEGTPWPWHVRLQSYLGILQFRVLIGIARLKAAEEPPTFPGARLVVSNLKFEAVVGILIIGNAALIGWDTMFAVGEQKPWVLEISEHIFTFIFMLEFILRIMAFSWVWVFDPMNLFDAFVVWIVGVLTTWILIPAGVDVDVIQRFAALRILRLARLCRAIRMIPIFHELWMLVKGVMECTPLLFWAGIIIGMVHFMFAVASMELVLKTETFKDDPDVEMYFGSLLQSMFTLFQIMTFDSWAMIVRPIIFKEPATAVLFFLFIGIAGIVLFDLMTAIVVKNSFDAMAEDEEAISQFKHAEHVRIQQELYDMFKDLDDDHSGTLSQKEFTDVLDDKAFIQKMKLLDIDLEELPDIFEILDDGDGQVSMEEFCTGLMRMQGVAMSRDMLMATQRLKRINDGFQQIDDEMLSYTEDTWDAVEDALDASHENFLEMQEMIALILKKLNNIGIRKVLHASIPQLPKLQEPTQQDIANQVKAAKQKPDALASKMVWLSDHPQAQMKSLPPSWVARRREEERRQRREKGKRFLRARAAKEQKHEEEEQILAGASMEFKEEWDKLQVRIDVPPLSQSTTLRATAGGAKSNNKLPEALTLPGSLVLDVASPSGGLKGKALPVVPPAKPPPLVPQQEDSVHCHPNSVPEGEATLV